MNAIQANGHHISINNPEQIINMGGSWVGDLYVDDQQLMSGCLVDNIVFDEPRNRIFVVNYHPVSKWQKDNYFTISMIDLDEKTRQESKARFKMLSLIAAENDKIVLVEAFHNRGLQPQKLYEIKGNFMPY